MRPAVWIGMITAAITLAATQTRGIVLTTDDLEGGFLYRRPFPVEGREWIALVRGPEGSVTSSARVAWEAGLDAGDSIFTLSADPEDPVLLIGDVPQLQAGPAVSATRGPEPLTTDWDTREIALGEAAYTLSLASEDPSLCDATITLSDGDRTQALYRADAQQFACDEPHFTVDWAGDLDGDARLDLVTTLSPKYSYYPRRLWLSSAAAAGDLVGLVAAYEGGD